jgi:hypothetical protein
MQRQLAALPLAPSWEILAPGSWPAGQCLTSLRLGDVSTHQGAQYCALAMMTTSLVDLQVASESPSMPAALLQVSNLHALTRLSLKTSADSNELDIGPHPAVAGAIGALSNLQRLRLDNWLFGSTTEGDERGEVPASWGHLTALTSFKAYGTRFNLRELRSLRSLQELDIANCCVARGSMSTLFPLTGLTRLRMPNVEDDYAHDEDGEEGAGAARDEEVPQQWKQGLKELFLDEASPGTLHVVSQLTGLEDLQLYFVHIKHELCR